MSLLLFSFSSTAPSHNRPLFFHSFSALSPSYTSLFPPQRPFQPLSSSSSSSATLRLLRCRAAVPDPPPPPPRNDSTHLLDVAAFLSKIQDRVQIFFAVLFWMSLFFWASAWDGRDRPNKGSRFRK